MRRLTLIYDEKDILQRRLARRLSEMVINSGFNVVDECNDSESCTSD